MLQEALCVSNSIEEWTFLYSGINIVYRRQSNICSLKAAEEKSTTTIFHSSRTVKEWYLKLNCLFLRHMAWRDKKLFSTMTAWKNRAPQVLIKCFWTALYRYVAGCFYYGASLWCALQYFGCVQKLYDRLLANSCCMASIRVLGQSE